MKRNQTTGLIAQLNRIKAELDAFTNAESHSRFLENLDGLIARLAVLREQLSQSPIEKKLSEVSLPLAQVIEFLQSAKDDQAIAAFISDALHSRSTKAHRVPIQIPPDLTNEQIRQFLSHDLSKGELKALAALRGISAGKRPDEEVRRDILRSLERQEGYERLASPRA